MAAKKKPQAVADTTGMDHEMQETLRGEVERRDKVMRRLPRIEKLPRRIGRTPQKKTGRG